MRKSKKQLLRTLMACGLVVSVAAGGTVAYLTDAETATNTFTVGKVKIDLEEPGYPGNDSDEVKNIIPNQEIVKDPQIENTGNNDALVFLRVEVPQETFTELDADNNVGEKKLQDLFKLKNVSDQWELLRTETTTNADGKVKTSYVYGYKKTLAKGSTTDKLFQKVQMKNSIEKDLEGDVEDIIVTACAIQVTDIPDVNLTPGSDGNLSKDVLDQVYTIFLNQSGDQKSRPADEGNRAQNGKLGKIYYSLNGGTIADGALTEYGSTDYGYTPPTPTKQGYKFAGWSPANIPTGSTRNMLFTAKWEPNTAKLYSGPILNMHMKRLAGNSSAYYNTTDTSIVAIQRSNTAPPDYVMEDSDYLMSSNNSTSKPAYMWYENGVIKWWSEAEEINAGSSLENLCYEMQNLTDISGLADWNTDSVTDMSEMFYQCNQLTDLTPIGEWRTDKVTDMSEMFGHCTELTELTPLANWKTDKVANMSLMFWECNQLTNLTPITHWKTDEVTNMASMFGGCSQLTDLAPLANWRTDKVIDMSVMFCGCSQLTNLAPLAYWKTGNVIKIYSMFNDCNQLSDASAINDWDITNVENFNYMFIHCPSHPEFTKRSGTWDSNGTFTPTT